MSQRDELANLIDDAIGWAGQEDIALAEHITDAILAAGYIKADREEWGVSWQPAGSIEPMDSKAEARDAIDRLVFGDRVRRLVGPWEVAE
ncbi:hypothetical protein GS435_18645 [Rhodococcus hoagii]|nr:hypothetical protein [Prescottella equi]MBM4521298.1 hypothetical protein [Prescottella equi]